MRRIRLATNEGGAAHHLDHANDVPAAMNDLGVGTQEGMRTAWIAMAAIGSATLIQVVIVLVSRSVALLADTDHDVREFLDLIPLLLAF